MKSKSKSFELHRHLPYLLRRAHFSADAAFVEIYGDAVTSRQLALLTAVEAMPGASQSQIAQEIGLDVNTCSDLVARSVAKGLLLRERSATDARSFCLYVSDEGKPVVRRGLKLAEIYSDTVAARLSADERAQLVDLLRKLLAFD